MAKNTNSSEGAGGAPTKYKKEYCKRTLKLMEDGKSICHLAKEFKVNRDTIYQWAKDNPEFSDTLAEGRDLAEAFWMNEGEAGLWNQGQGISFNATVWKYFMANRFDWRDKQEVDQTLTEAPKEPDYSGLSKEERQEMARLVKKAESASDSKG